MISPRAPRCFLNLSFSPVEVHFLNEMSTYYGIARNEFLRRLITDAAVDYASIGIYAFPAKELSLSKTITVREMKRRHTGRKFNEGLPVRKREDKAKD